MKILLDYFFPITAIEPTQPASTAFLKQACLVVKPLDVDGDYVGEVQECFSMDDIADFTNNDEAAQLFAAGMSRVFILPMNHLDMGATHVLEGHESDFYTILISSDFSDAEATSAKANATVTITSYANLVSGTDDAIVVDGVTFTAQAGAATPGQATFQAATSNNATAASLAAQINAHLTGGANVHATATGADVLIEAKDAGGGGNSIGLSYTDNDTNIGATLADVDGGNLSGGSGLFLGAYRGVTGISSDDDDFLSDQATITNRCAFHSSEDSAAKNMLFAFGKLLSNLVAWKNQQYITMPIADDVDTLGKANSLFDSKISFVISDDEFGKRLALFCAGGEAIVAPYVKKNLEIDLQSAALSYISGNQPAKDHKNASLLEDDMQKVVKQYIARQDIETGSVAVSIDTTDQNFVATSEITISEPDAFWRIFGEMRTV